MKLVKFILETRCKILKKCAVYCRAKDTQYISRIQIISCDQNYLDLNDQKIATELISKYSVRSATYSKWYNYFNNKYQNTLKSLQRSD